MADRIDDGSTEFHHDPRWGREEPFHYVRKAQIVYFAGAAASIPVAGRREISLAKRFISLAN